MGLGLTIASASRARMSGASSCSPVRPCTRGSSAAIIFSRSLGFFQKRSNACSKNFEVIALRHEHRRERFPEIRAIGDADRLDRGQRVDHLGGTDRQSRRAQQPYEMKDVLREKAARQRDGVLHMPRSLERPDGRLRERHGETNETTPSDGRDSRATRRP